MTSSHLAIPLFLTLHTFWRPLSLKECLWHQCYPFVIAEGLKFIYILSDGECGSGRVVLERTCIFQIERPKQGYSWRYCFEAVRNILIIILFQSEHKMFLGFFLDYLFNYPTDCLSTIFSFATIWQLWISVYWLLFYFHFQGLQSTYTYTHTRSCLSIKNPVSLMLSTSSICPSSVDRHVILNRSPFAARQRADKCHLQEKQLRHSECIKERRKIPTNKELLLLLLYLQVSWNALKMQTGECRPITAVGEACEAANV